MNQHDALEKYRSAAESFFSQFSEKQIEELNKEEIQRVKKDHEKFVLAFKEGNCSICQERLGFFNSTKPCLHWLLYPAGFDKKHFQLIFKQFNYLQLQSFLRWVANIELFVGNINDLEEEKNPKKAIEFSIRYKNLEWSFSCSDSDIQGHESASHPDARLPHYHFQMRINGKPFIDYSDFHIPFTEEDKWHLPIMLGMVEHAGPLHGPGMGMQGAMEREEAEGLLNSLVRTDDESKSVFHISTLIQAKPGTLISGDEIAELIKRSKETGVPLTKLLGELKNVEKQLTVIEPGPIVPEQAGRKKGKKKN